ncbi:MAG: ribosome biogenesis GTP-binding protein YihA/YsxC [Desulfovibrionaceae bacterium]|nr:ribosome biogenesis GTP-binding protein YihA/YsxC [Desulfovibrionaceae bacterium]
MPKLILESTVYTLEQLCSSPLLGHPQAALAGRSNVGKSSLINALAGQKHLAKVSSTPGKTASINFYRAEPEGFYLADLPGYGYARRGRGERRDWSRLIREYLQGANPPLALVLLLDCRLEPQEADLDLVAFARSMNLRLLPVLTKADQCARREQESRRREWALLVPEAHLLLVSSVGPASSRIGLEELWAALRLLFQRP